MEAAVLAVDPENRRISLSLDSSRQAESVAEFVRAKIDEDDK